MTEHLDVKEISVVGPTPGAKVLDRQCAEHGKRCQAQGGAYNFLVVMPDVDLDAIMPNIIESCFGNAGQRCPSGAVILGITVKFLN